MIATLGIPRSRPEPAAGDNRNWLMLELAKDALQGLNRDQVVDLLAGILFGAGGSPEEESGGGDSSGAMAGGNPRRGLYVYTFPMDLPYRIGLTNGILGDGIREEVVIVEKINFNMTTREALRYPANHVESAKWKGDVYNEAGDPTTAPALTVSGNELISSFSVYGTCAVSYLITRTHYDVEITPRSEGRNRYSCWAWAAYDGGVEMLEMGGSEYGASDDDGEEEEGGESTGSGDGDPPWKPPTVDGENEHVYIDYCTQEEIEI